MIQPAVASQKNQIRRRWVVLAVLCLPLFLIAIDNSILNLALPAISNDLGSSNSQLQWITNAYVLAFASVLLTTGAISDRYGRKLLLLIGLGMFGIGSLGAALSNSTGMLIFSRGFLGFAGAMIAPSTLSIIVDIFREAKERAQAIGIWAAVFALGAGIGPIIGGYLLEYFDWGAVFLINLPVVAITLLLAYFLVHESKGENAPRPDILGMLISIMGLVSIVYGIIEAGEKGWGDASVLTYLGIGTVLILVFVIVERKIYAPMLPPKFFKNMSFTVASVAMVLTIFAMAGSLFLVSMYFQTVQGYSPIAAAYRLLPLAMTMFVTAVLSARIADKIGAKLTIIIGVLLTGTGLYYLSQIVEVDSPYGLFVLGIVMTAIGLGLSSPPATTYIVGSLPVNRAGIASGVNTVTRQLGMALGVALLGSLMNSTYREKITEIQGLKDWLSNDMIEVVRNSIQGAHIIARDQHAYIARQIVDGANHAFVSGMIDAMYIGAVILWGTAIFAIIFLPRKVRCSEEV